MVISLIVFLFFVGKNLIPYLMASKLEKEVPKPAFNASVQAPVTFSVLSASAVASPAPEEDETASVQDADPQENTSKPLTKEERVQAILKESEVLFGDEGEETRFAEEDVPVSEEFKELLEINPHTVGWLTVGEIADYPVVKRDNEFYLTHDKFIKRL